MGRKVRKQRKQRIVLREKQRVALHQRMTSSFFILGGAAVFLLMLKTVSRQAALEGFFQKHTPIVELDAPETLAQLPLLKQAPQGYFLLWLPGAEWSLQRRWLHQCPAIGDVQFEKHFSHNRIVARLEPRIPLVRLNDQGVDKEGTVFPLVSPNWASLPKAVLSSSKSMPALGHWLFEMTRTPDLWSKVVAISQDARGDMWLDLQTGARVAWGPPEVSVAREKARCLAMVLGDAHQRLNGAAAADMRFFEEGRVIVRPKTAI